MKQTFRIPMTSHAVALLLLPGMAIAQNDPRYQGPKSCALCHSQRIIESSDAELKPGVDQLNPLVSRDFCGMNEFSTFLNQDQHRHAYHSLTSPRGREMADVLGYDVTSANQCLSCHSNQYDPVEYRTFGITCEACHGPSRDWVTPHYELQWRSLSIAEKESKGLVDLRNPAKKARKCFSCHIGNALENKVLTHQMYAAGHPPLPGIELTTFDEQMPSHWRSLREKGNFEHRDEFVAQSAEHNQNPDFEHHVDLPQTRAVVIGGVVALSEHLKLLADVAGNSQESWPELSVFNCQACHHELQRDSWRRMRGFGNRTAGRPFPAEWPHALVAPGFHQLATDKQHYRSLTSELEKRLKPVWKEFNAQPFGRAEALVAQIRGDDGIAVWLDQHAEQLVGSTFDQSAVRELVRQLVDAEVDRYPDVHSARQIIWALRTILVELRTPYPDFPETQQNGQRDFELFTRWQGLRAQSAETIDLLFAQHPQIQALGRPWSVARNTHPSGTQDNQLQLITDYDAVAFRRQLAELARSISSTESDGE